MAGQVIGFIGDSGSGKTTLIVQIVARLVADGRNVSVIKHTHHEASVARTGDTERFLAAGASTAWLYASGSATRFSADSVSAHTIQDPDSWLATLVASFDDGFVIVEGFRLAGTWPRLLVIGDDGNVREPDGSAIVAIVSDHPTAADIRPALPHFRRSEAGIIVAFVDRISGS